MPEVGVIYDPYRDELFTAIRGQGAFMNGHRIKGGALPLFHLLHFLASAVLPLPPYLIHFTFPRSVPLASCLMVPLLPALSRSLPLPCLHLCSERGRAVRSGGGGVGHRARAQCERSHDAGGDGTHHGAPPRARPPQPWLRVPGTGMGGRRQVYCVLSVGPAQLGSRRGCVAALGLCAEGGGGFLRLCVDERALGCLPGDECASVRARASV